MQTHPNQKTVTIHKTDPGNHYIVLNYDIVCNAFKDLKPYTCLMWIYLCKNKNNLTFAMSKADAKSCFGISPQQYRLAVQELIQKNYLVKKPNTNNQYIFYDTPLKTEQIRDDDQWRYDILPL